MKDELGQLSNNPQGLLLEAIHSAGYSGALANPLLAPESALNRLDGAILEEFVHVRKKNILGILQLSCTDYYYYYKIYFHLLIYCYFFSPLFGFFFNWIFIHVKF